MEAHVRSALRDDVPLLARRLRAVDLHEIAVLSGRTPEAALQRAFETTSQAWSIVDAEGVPFAMFGVATYSPGVGSVWLLATDDFTRAEHRRPFARHCRAWVEAMQADYPILFNFISRENALSIRWLKWCGFEFAPTAHPDFLIFTRRAPDV